MLVSLKNISRFVSISDLTPEEIAKGLTFTGLEVEEITRMASGTNLVVGHILECEAHPNSDHLHILKVDLGPKYGVEQIVCGAPNARKDLKVIVARVGAKLPQVEIKKGVIRGVESNGMCCSLLELGVDAKYLSDKQKEGIEELDSSFKAGSENVLELLGLDDVVLNINILANRPDLLSTYNVAKEIGAIFQREVNIPSYKVDDDFKTDFKVGSDTLSCTQFSLREIHSVTTKESPKWMQEELMSLGCRSINNIVDIGNYVMFLTGQPLHMYDVDKLAKHELIAKNDYEGKFVALDENEYSIIKNDLVIASNNKPMCLGGVMGSLECAVDANSKNIAIEAASFDSATIRHTSNRLGLSSESSQRFVKGTNHFQAEEVINFASYLLKEFADAKEFSNIVTYQSETKKDKRIDCSVSYINNRLGTEFTASEIKDALERLHFKVELKDNDNFAATVPTYRLDVDGKADLSEEVIRLLGFSHVKSTLPTIDTTLGVLSPAQSRGRLIRRFLRDQGLDECLTYTLVSENDSKAFNLLNEEEQYKLLNPITEDRKVVRTHILNSLLNVASFNVNRQNKNLALFEWSKVQSTVSEHFNLAIVLVGKDIRRGLLETMDYDFYHMKGLFEGIMAALGFEASRYSLNPLSAHIDLLHPGKSCDVVFQGKVIGRFGELHPNMITKYDLGKTNAVVLEMRIDEIISSKVSIAKMEPISKFPVVTRDIAFLVDNSISCKDILKTIKMSGSGIVSASNIFDVYTGSNIAPDKKSLAITITFHKEDATLTDNEINNALDEIKFALGRVYHVEFRM